LRENFWWTTQPIEEPAQIAPRRGNHRLDRLGPHCDQDKPSFSFKFPITEEQRRKIFRDHALALYRFQ